MNQEIEVLPKTRNFVPVLRQPAPIASRPAQLPSELQSAMERMLSAPAPVPSRDMRISERQRLEGAIEKSTPILRATAALVRSLPVMGILMFVGISGYVVVGYGDVVTVVTILACLITLVVFNTLEYRHSQPGVERQRAKLDHKLEMTHEDNRHCETMTAIEGDLALKNKILDVAIQKMLGG